MFVGVDVAARWLDVAFGPSGEVLRVSNPEGIPALLDRLPSGAVVGLEATGTYYRPLAYALFRAGFRVYVLNPAAVKAFGRSLLRRAKTDKADARLIARFLSERYQDLTPYQPSDDALALLSVLVRLWDGLTSDWVGVLNRLHAWEYAVPGLSGLVRYVPSTIDDLRARVLREALAIATSDPVLSSWLQAIRSLPGFGPVLALKVLAYSGDLRRFSSARAYAAFTGLTPRLVQSGEARERARISRVGPPRLRAVFYLAGVLGYRSSPEYRAFVEGLMARGKPRKVALTALANRLARAVWSVCVKGGLTKWG
ncbi:IS110 family transposase [Thermus sp. PS18]|uniref:IS110 family transposase n=1 Tax=Thermus sp. PS18 TaxID=2849039 RepID=UPI002263DA03|nr:IS110 family transposase [Thermus sp. PS18]UZX16519.1 IS110 family transposase [Thermus sp. PS18]